MDIDSDEYTAFYIVKIMGFDCSDSKRTEVKMARFSTPCLEIHLSTHFLRRTAHKMLELPNSRSILISM